MSMPHRGSGGPDGPAENGTKNQRLGRALSSGRRASALGACVRHFAPGSGLRSRARPAREPVRRARYSANSGGPLGFPRRPRGSRPSGPSGRGLRSPAVEAGYGAAKRTTQPRGMAGGARVVSGSGAPPLPGWTGDGPVGGRRSRGRPDRGAEAGPTSRGRRAAGPRDPGPAPTSVVRCRRRRCRGAILASAAGAAREAVRTPERLPGRRWHEPAPIAFRASRRNRPRTDGSGAPDPADPT